MSQNANANSSPQYLFVGDTALKGRTDGIRSSMIRRALSDSRARRRQEVNKEIDSMLRRRDSVLCNCPAPLPGPVDRCHTPNAPRQSTATYRRIQPRTRQATVTEALSARCQSCGGMLPGISPPMASFQAGNRDPMLPSDPNLPGIEVQDILNFAGTQIWPNMRPLDYSSNCYREWVFPWEDKLKIYIVLWSASYHRDMLRITNAPNQEVDSTPQLQLKALALHRLREEVDNVALVTSPDGLVMSILFLAVNVSHRTGLGGESSPFSPPFTGLHALNHYGSRKYHPVHWGILHNIIQRFGGVGSIKAFAVAWLLSISDIMNAVNTLQMPIYPPLGAHGQVLDLKAPLALFNIRGLGLPSNSPAGLGFQALASLSPRIRQEVINVFTNVGQYSCVVQYYSIETCSPAILDLLGDSRNLVHHRLFSLLDENADLSQVLESHGPSAEEDSDLSQELYLFCRSSVILYAVHVSYPIPRPQGLRTRILATLRPRLDRLMATSHGALEPLLLWSLVVIVISSGDIAPVQLLKYVGQLCSKLKVDSKEKLLRILRSFAWVESAVPDTAPFWVVSASCFFRAARTNRALRQGDL
ncbi:hypothetical protein ASPCAL00491 [Aspergillus calidoustus]|uniref:Transcription factor domain-containing protein n=1 Tax=Aspergillus calidoustus TaxID=454130 RepID=A0A0U5FNR1_ASPCI|nr:hypothetical protein ASPCAL00491 [Aspergillus calidoustus]